jgi:hypothetical protein
MYKILIFALAGFVLWKLLTGDKKRKKVQEHEKKEQMAATGQMVKDPICGAFVSVDSDIRVRQGDAVHRFCSYDCRDAFLARIQSAAEPKAVNSAGEKSSDD